MKTFERDLLYKGYCSIMRSENLEFILYFPIYSKIEHWYLYENNLYKNPKLNIDGKTIGIINDDGIIDWSTNDEKGFLIMSPQSLDLFDYVEVTPRDNQTQFNYYNGKLLVQ